MPTKLMIYIGSDVGGLIRYSAIKTHLIQNGEKRLWDKTVEEVDKAGRTCTIHGFLEDPILAVVSVMQQLLVACPHCSGSVLRQQWESQGPKN